MSEIPFTKMAGAGNDFLLIDARNGGVKRSKPNWRRLAVALCDRRRGIGADGVLAILPSSRADAAMRIFNADGSEAAMCGNGIRCVAYYLGRRSAGRRRSLAGEVSAGSVAGRSGRVSIHTGAGILSARVRGRRVAIDMPDPSEIRLGLSLLVGGHRLELSSINTGVPHVVVPVASLDRVDVEGLGRRLRRHPAFQPHGTNVNFIHADPRHPGRLRLRTYERGVEGETLACGTGAAAAAILSTLQRLGRRAGPAAPTAVRVEVDTRSREALTIAFRVAGRRRVTDVVMEGPVQVICRGVAPWPLEGDA